MRGLLNALTTRGKTFLAIGALTALTGLIFSEADLLRIGVLLMLLPVLSALTTSRARYRLSCTRQLVPRQLHNRPAPGPGGRQLRAVGHRPVLRQQEHAGGDPAHRPAAPGLDRGQP